MSSVCGLNSSRSSALEIHAELIDGDGKNDGYAEDELLVFLDDFERDESEIQFAYHRNSVLDELKNEDTQDGAESGAATSGEGGAADDGGGDDIELITSRRCWWSRREKIRN